MDAIDSLAAGARLARATFDGAARQVAAADLPTVPNPDPTNPLSPSPPVNPEVDVVGRLVTMNVAADMHHVTTAALRSAFSLYRASIDLLRPERDASTGRSDGPEV